MIRIQDLNASREIGANSHLLEMGPFRILVDAGIHPKKVGLEAAPQLEAIGPHLDLVILTHCHLDHLGAIPLVMKQHPNVPICVSEASRILAPRMMHNSCNVMERQRAELGIPEYPLYTHSEVDALKNNWYAMPMGRPKIFEKGSAKLSITFYPAGHIVGAVGCKLVYKNQTVFLTGDVLFENQKTLTGALFPEEPVDVLITETTRGLTVRDPSRSREQEIERLLEVVRRTCSQGGICLIPVFALGRMQELMAIIHQYFKSQASPQMFPVFASGLGLDLADYIDEIGRKTPGVYFRRKILKELKVRPISFDLRTAKRIPQGIYLLSSGMLVENTPSYALAAAIAHDSRNTIAFVGYCDPDTPGGQMLQTPHGAPFGFNAFKRVVNLKAHVERFDLSGHADRDELLNFAVQSKAKTVVLTHGEVPSRAWFEQALTQAMPGVRVVDPEPRQWIEL